MNGKRNKSYFSENCRICKGPFKQEHTLKEMMFGFRDEFLYQECSSCGCLQIKELPTNILKYYPPYYYSFTQDIAILKKQPLLKRLFKNFRRKKLYRGNNALLKYLKPINVKFEDKILDVGCGKGKLICDLFNKGFENITGVDKFVPQETDYGYGVKVMKKDLSELPHYSYDLIMMHHVLEHIAHQQKTLLDCHKLLKGQGCLLIRIPILGEAWEIYRNNWVQLDAPRHFFLHTLKSMNILANQTGFEIRETMFDSTSFQFLGSELYKKDTPLYTAVNNYQSHVFENLFDAKVLQGFEQKAEELNAHKKGDSAAFYLYKR
jgi:2-polyprenyl-3-methyl-5-hydroxy-6-metoxy-1,4-benzoquinol methylase